MLVSTGRTTEEQLTEATTMEQVATEYQRSLEEFGQQGFRRGHDEGQAAILRDMVTQKFGPETAEELSSLLGEISGTARISRVASAVLECGTAEDFIARVRNLLTGFSLWVPGDYRVVSRGLEEDPRSLRDDLALTILDLELERSVEGTLRALRALRRHAEESGSEYDRFMAECVVEMLVSTGRTTQEQMTEVTTMAQVVTKYQRSLDEFGERRFHRGRNVVQAGILHHLVTQKFGPETAEELSSLLGEISGSAHIPRVASAVLECGTAEEFIARVRNGLTG